MLPNYQTISLHVEFEPVMTSSLGDRSEDIQSEGGLNTRSYPIQQLLPRMTSWNGFPSH
jgi:hypothetical protein